MPSTSQPHLGCSHRLGSWSRMSSLEGPVWNLPGHLSPFLPYISSAQSSVADSKGHRERANTTLHPGSGP